MYAYIRLDRNLGIVFDSEISFSEYINSVLVCPLGIGLQHPLYACTSRRHILFSALTYLVNALASSRLDYCNSLLIAISKVNFMNFREFKILWPGLSLKLPNFKIKYITNPKSITLVAKRKVNNCQDWTSCIQNFTFKSNS